MSNDPHLSSFISFPPSGVPRTSWLPSLPFLKRFPPPFVFFGARCLPDLFFRTPSFLRRFEQFYRLYQLPPSLCPRLTLKYVPIKFPLRASSPDPPRFFSILLYGPRLRLLPSPGLNIPFFYLGRPAHEMLRCPLPSPFLHQGGR